MFLTKYSGAAYATRFFLIFLDTFLSFFSYFLALMLVNEFHFPTTYWQKILFTMVLFTALRLPSYKIFKTYSGILRFTGEEDLKRVFFALTVSSSLLWLLKLIPGFEDIFYIPFQIVFLEYVISLFLFFSYRISMRVIMAYFRKNSIEKHKVVIFGAGQSGLITKKAVSNDTLSDMKVVAILDDNPNVHNKLMEGVKIYGTSHFADVVKKENVKRAIIAINNISRQRKQEIVDMCLENNITPMIVPPVNKWLDGGFNQNQIRNVKIEDLLNREQIVLDKEGISSQLQGKVVLVTGAAGSIGSEMARQISLFKPKYLILLDQAESPLVELHLEIEEGSNGEGNYIIPIVADVADKDRVEAVFKEYRPDIIYHAAAYKHVPMMERHPYEAIQVNVGGTKNIADLAVKYKTEKFVLVSTDKAVNPTNVMGASKRIAEIYTQSFNNYTIENERTKFITTRFGNVLGSNGSVIPRFKKQIEAGGPLTVTHPDITRYFMTIPEACQLVLEAGAMGKGGEIYVFDMGSSVKIADLAKRMIKLSGLKPGEDIEIVFTGLRSGEKIYEELLNKSEDIIPTHHKKIMIGKVREYQFEKVRQDILDLLTVKSSNDEMAIVGKMKSIVPEFISNNSKFNELDAKNTLPGIAEGEVTKAKTS